MTEPRAWAEMAPWGGAVKTKRGSADTIDMEATGYRPGMSGGEARDPSWRDHLPAFHNKDNDLKTDLVAESGGRFVGFLRNVARPSFEDRDEEAQYRQLTFGTHRLALSRSMLMVGLLYTGSLAVTIVRTARNEGLEGSRATSGAYLALRFSFVGAMLIGAAVVRWVRRLSPGGATAVMLALVYALVIVSYSASLLVMAGEAEFEESREAVLAYLCVYAVLVPIFQIHHLTAAMLLLMCVQIVLFLIYGYVTESESKRETFKNMLALEAFKALLLNVLGVGVAHLGDRQQRDNFQRAAQFQSEEEMQHKIRNDVHRLLCNTLPAPIVRDIAMGRVEVAHRYEQVTVLQSDMSGFTQLSASTPPEKVLGILSDLFGRFDRLASRFGVHKVKTIGDAYVAIGGAFSLTQDKPEAARRIVRMGLAMARVVRETAKDQGIDIGVRIGVHTGVVVGGIIGTVRFHFDMWGNGVIGAMKMEEMGSVGRVHVSDATAMLIGDSFRITAGREQMEPKFVDSYGISSSSFIEDENWVAGPDQAPDASTSTAITSVGERVRHAQHGDGTVEEHMSDGRTRIKFDSGDEHRYKKLSMDKILRISDNGELAPVDSTDGVVGVVGAADPAPFEAQSGFRTRSRRSVANILENARKSSGGDLDRSSCTLSEMSMPSELAGMSSGGIKGFLKATRHPGWLLERAASRNLRPSMTMGRASRALLKAKKTHDQLADQLAACTEERESAVAAEAAAEGEAAVSGAGGSGAASGGGGDGGVSGGSGKPEGRSSSGGGGGAIGKSVSSRASHAVDGFATFVQRRQSAHLGTELGSAPNSSNRLTNRQTNPLAANEAGFFADTDAISDTHLREAKRREKEVKSSLLEQQAANIRQCGLLLLAVVVSGLYDLLTYFFAMVAKDLSYVTNLLLLRYAVFVPMLLMLRAGIRQIKPQSRKHTQISSALLVALPSLMLAVMMMVIRPRVEPCHDQDASPCRGEDMPAAPPPPGLPSDEDAAMLPAEALCAGRAGGRDYCYYAGLPETYVTVLGMIHTFLHYTLVYSKLATLVSLALGGTLMLLGAIHLNVNYLVISETHPPPESMVTLLFEMTGWLLLAHALGILHFLSRRGALWQHLVLRARQKLVLQAIREETQSCETLLKSILPAHLLQKLPRGVMPGQLGKGDETGVVAEKFHGCSFLFAKICGLSSIIDNDASGVEPRLVMQVLQHMFDRFDKLADVFQVQKVRKTANEYYLVAAGLPDPALLPSETDRACGIAGFGFALINIMEVVNLEMRSLGIDGVKFSVQVGIDSGFAIAGVIGHKTFQYDLCGDAVNTAARMCSYSEPGRVHVSQRTHQLLCHRFDSILRGEREIKGKGMMKTYFLANAPPESAEEAVASAAAASAIASASSSAVAAASSSTSPARRKPSQEGGGGAHHKASLEGSMPMRPERSVTRDPSKRIANKYLNSPRNVTADEREEQREVNAATAAAPAELKDGPGRLLRSPVSSPKLKTPAAAPAAAPAEAPAATASPAATPAAEPIAAPAAAAAAAPASAEPLQPLEA